MWKINELEKAANCAIKAARQAWQQTRHYYKGEYTIHNKSDGPVTEADRLANHVILELLEEEFPPSQCGYLSEEIIDDKVRFDRKYLWIIDPIDGTEDFIKGTDNFAMHIGLSGLMDDKFIPLVGVVYHPVRDRLFFAIKGEGAYVEEYSEKKELIRSKIHVSGIDDISHMRAVISYTHRTRRLTRLMERLPIKEFYTLGSMGLKMCEVASGKAEIYVNISSGKFKEWDICAPHLIVEESGGQFTDLEGYPIYYNKLIYIQQIGVLASNAMCHQPLLNLINKNLVEL